MYFRVNFEVHSGYGGPFRCIPVSKRTLSKLLQIIVAICYEIRGSLTITDMGPSRIPVYRPSLFGSEFVKGRTYEFFDAYQSATVTVRLILSTFRVKAEYKVIDAMSC